jgi:hypothetical protein
MDFLETILKEKSGDLIGALTSKAGYSAGEAERFVPAAGSSVVQAMKSQAGSLDLDDLQNAANLGQIMKGVDIAGLAKKVGITPEQSAKGLTAMLPLVLGFMKDHGEGLKGLLGMLGGADGGLGDALGGLKGAGGLKGLGKLFGR